MVSSKQLSRVDTAELKSQLFKKLGRVKAEKYFYNLKMLLSLKVGKFEFDKLCYGIVGKENIGLHNLFIKSILHNACVDIGPRGKSVVTGNSGITNVCSNGDPFTPSPQRGRSVDSKNWRPAERPSSLGLCCNMPLEQTAKNSSDFQRSGEQHSLPDLISIGSKRLLGFATVEDGEEVEQVSISTIEQSRSPIKPPLGISLVVGRRPRKSFRSDFPTAFQSLGSSFPTSCRISSELPDSVNLKRRLEQRLMDEGLGVSVDCANMLNHGLDAFLRRLIKPCMDLSGSRCKTRMNHLDRKVSPCANFVQTHNSSYHASLLDFRVAMESNPLVLGNNWPTHLEKLSLYLAQDLRCD